MSKKPKIKAWRPAAPLNPVDDLLKKIELAITAIYDLSGSVSFQEIYKCGYDLVHQSKGDLIYKQVTELILKYTTKICEIELFDQLLLEKVQKI